MRVACWKADAMKTGGRHELPTALPDRVGTPREHLTAARERLPWLGR